MSRRQAALLAGIVVVAAALWLLVFTDDPLPGQVRFLRSTSGTSSDLVTHSSAAAQEFMASHYWRMRGHSPFFDQALEWAPASHAYQDLYALYPDQAADRRLVREHPAVVLRDSAGNPLFIPFDCDGESCAAWAADPGADAWRREWLDRASDALERGYAGLFIDNVNLEMLVGDADGEPVAPIDPRTGAEMTLEDWRRYVAEFAELIDEELPGAEIVQNSAWYLDESDPYVQRAAEAADWVEIERGFTDPGLRPSSQAFSLEALLEHVDWIHDRGAGFITEPYSLDEASRYFELAAYLLVNDSDDAIASNLEANPDNWWPGWEADLGDPDGDRYETDGLLRRDFADGLAALNPQGNEPATLEAPEGMEDLDGVERTEITLEPGEGIVLQDVE